MATPRRRRLWKWLLAELAIVFLGVSLASYAEDYRQHRSDQALSRQVVAALGRSLVDLGKHEHEVGSGLDAELARFDSDRKRGLRPVPPVYRETMAERPPTLVWGALVETGGARLLPPDLLFDFARFFNRMDSLGERYIRYNQFSEERFLPSATRAKLLSTMPAVPFGPNFASISPGCANCAKCRSRWLPMAPSSAPPWPRSIRVATDELRS